MKSFIVDKPLRLSKIIPEKIEGISYSLVMKLLRAKDVKVNSVRQKNDIKVSVGDRVEVYYDENSNLKKVYETIYVDENVLIVNKFNNVTSEQLFELLKREYNEIYFIHRLDRNTSGIMVFALNQESEIELLFGFKNRTFTKKYITTVYGKMPKKSDTLVAYLTKNSETSTVKITAEQVKGSSKIITQYEVLKENDETSDLLITLVTGKTHQIRAHLAFIGHFIIGDGKYGENQINKRFNEKRQKLSAFLITFKFDNTSKLYYLNNRTFSLK